MTNKDAIENLKMIHLSFINPCTEEQRHIITDTFEVAIDSLKAKPRAKGHWKTIVSHEVGEYRPTKYVCSECGWMIDLCRGLRQEQGFRLFCEHCGADMR